MSLAAPHLLQLRLFLRPGCSAILPARHLHDARQPQDHDPANSVLTAMVPPSLLRSPPGVHQQEHKLDRYSKPLRD
jgi:hypothetical protein